MNRKKIDLSLQESDLFVSLTNEAIFAISRQLGLTALLSIWLKKMVQLAVVIYLKTLIS